MSKHVAHIGGMSNAYKILIGKSEGKRPLVGVSSMYEDVYYLN